MHPQSKGIVAKFAYTTKDKADGDGLNASLASHDWSALHSLDAHSAAQLVTDGLFNSARKFTPQRTICERKSTHPWLNDRVMIELVATRWAAEGTELENQKMIECSAGILEEYGKYVVKVRGELQALPRGAKKWWSKARRLMSREGATSAIPALRRNDRGEWLLDTTSKADLFVDTFSNKFKLADAETNGYTCV